MALATIVASHAFEPGVPRSYQNFFLNLARHNKTSCYEVCKPEVDAFLFKKHDYDEENTDEQNTDEQNIDEQESKHLAATSCILDCEHDKVTTHLDTQLADLLEGKAKVEKALRLWEMRLQSMGVDSVWTEDGPVIKAPRDETGMRSLAYH
ncbi:hypothetical protein LTR97_011802 [Elasticomyces elasticus]|uniref:Uncharacterized protein n=1 Tax=Elasticomyces elasticus TaxID=574655 RepID=A0AAN7ZQT2_9PEZI|nr:hypothetical protein LTR97_011802 [Elasticomyces elasticus]